MKGMRNVRVCGAGALVGALGIVTVTGTAHAAQVEPEPCRSDGAVERTKEFAQQSFKNDTETRTQALAFQDRVLADRFEKVLSDFIEIGGYFRAGYGRNSEGGALAAFRAPGAGAKYRLGNEAENYGELVLGKNLYLPGVFHVDEDLRPDGTPSGPIARVQLRLSFYNPHESLNSTAATSVGLPEAWASIGNVIVSQPEVKFWAGNRFYRRHDVHINDFYFWDMSGGGGGIEDIEVGPAKVALAWIGAASTSGLGYLPQPDPENEAGWSKSNFDLRVYDLPLWGGNAELGLVFAVERSGEDQSGNSVPGSEGMSFNFVHTTKEFISDDGVNKFSIQYGTGPAKTFTSGFETETLSQGVFIRADDPSSWRIRITENFTANLNQYFSLGPVVVFQRTNYGGPEGQQDWISAGVRPIVHFNQYFSLATEGGMDWVHDQAADTTGALYKLTFAPQVSVGNRFSSRPAVRAFVSLARWTEDFIGQVGGLDYSDSQSGLNWGMQMEAWW